VFMRRFSLKKLKKSNFNLLVDLKEFFFAYFVFFKQLLFWLFHLFETSKSAFSSLLYRQRGRWSQPFAHFWLTLFLFLGIVFTPKIEEGLKNQEFEWDVYSPSSALASYAVDGTDIVTIESSHLRGEIVEYVVRKGDTVSSIANKFGVSIDTIIWANNIKSVTSIKPGDRLSIPPVTGVVHKVQRGETVYSVAKKYQANPQAIVDFPFNTFANDETFALAVGQTLIVPDGIPPKATPSAPRKLAVTTAVSGGGTGLFIWPTSGRITQRYSWYHRAIDIADSSAPTIIASAAGKVIKVIHGRYGYGNHVVVDHGDGYQTLYAHMSQIYVSLGQNLSAGQAIGQMGSTGKSTGIHLHFEIIKGGVKLDPLTILK